MRFVNRKKELEVLEKENLSKGAKFIVIYGRRRIGKTRLIEEFIKNKKEHIYYLAADEKDTLQIKELKTLLVDFFHDDFLSSNDFKDWKLLFSYLKKIWPKNKKIILIIDEVTYILKNNPSFSSYLQQFWDSFLSKTNTMLILSGSLVGLMLKNVLGENSPLYGRRTAEIFLEEFEIDYVREFLNKPLEETINFFSVLGGIPKYLELVKEDFNGFLSDIFDKKSFFYREGFYLMTEEFNDISTYSNILKAIAEGKTKLNEIADYSGFESKKISAYLNILESLGFIMSLVPITKEEKKFRGKIYLINDSFLEFWFRFINKNRSLIELDKKEYLIKKVDNEINSFIGRKFEKVCKQFIILSEKFTLTKIGKQWGKILNMPKDKNQYEIDICAVNEDAQEILFAECKWQDKVDALSVLYELKEKAKYVNWHNQDRKEYYVVFAKSFKERIREKNIMLFDLKDMENGITQRTK